MTFTENSRQSILDKNPIEKVIRSYGIELKKQGSELVCICPFHDDHSPSMRINEKKQVFTCDPCGKGGSVIDFVAMKENISIGESMKKLAGEIVETKRPMISKEVCRYSYTDETGKILYKVVRYDPKTFRQCRLDSEGKIQWNMEDVRRVLYNLPKVLKAKTVWIVEGEKDADNLNALALTATCNVGGSGKWMDGYTNSLSGKDIVICPDNDEAGKKHLDVIMSSIAGKVKSVCVVKIPSDFKDVSDFIKTFKSKEEAGNALCRIADEQPKLTAGIDLPIYSMDELETEYKEFVSTIEHSKLDLSKWLPGLSKIRGLVPGETVSILADTGVGKTAILQNISYHAKPLTVLMFSIELPSTLVFERYVQMSNRIQGQAIEDAFKRKIAIDWRTGEKLNHIHVCPLSKVTPEIIEELIIKSELKIGKKPDVVMIDYIGLVKATGKSRYETVSIVAEELKRIAKSTKTIIIMASQIHRKNDNDSNSEIYLHDAKDSGSVENSSGLIIGVWKESKDKMNVKILKGTKGGAGLILPCDFDGETLRIWQSH